MPSFGTNSCVSTVTVHVRAKVFDPKLIALNSQASSLADHQSLAALVVSGLLRSAIPDHPFLATKPWFDLGCTGAYGSLGHGGGAGGDDHLAR